MSSLAAVLKYEIKHENKYMTYHVILCLTSITQLRITLKLHSAWLQWLWGMRHRMTWYVAIWLVSMLYLIFWCHSPSFLTRLSDLEVCIYQCIIFYWFPCCFEWWKSLISWNTIYSITLYINWWLQKDKWAPTNTFVPSVATVATDVFRKNWILNAKEIS